jgi:hypothetical protein
VWSRDRTRDHTQPSEDGRDQIRRGWSWPCPGARCWPDGWIKQYLKDGRALRIETVINDAYDIGCQRLPPNLDDLQARPVRSTSNCWTLNESARAHRPCESSLRADRAVHRHRRWQEGPSLEVRRPSGPSPGQHAVRRHRHHQQEPARLDGRTARHPLQPEPGQLRPCPTAPQRTDHPRPRPQPLHPDPRRPAIRDLLHQNPRPGPTTPPRRPRQPHAPPELRVALHTIDQAINRRLATPAYPPQPDQTATRKTPPSASQTHDKRQNLAGVPTLR